MKQPENWCHTSIYKSNMLQFNEHYTHSSNICKQRCCLDKWESTVYMNLHVYILTYHSSYIYFYCCTVHLFLCTNTTIILMCHMSISQVQQQKHMQFCTVYHYLKKKYHVCTYRHKIQTTCIIEIFECHELYLFSAQLKH